jgi:hypothetical protein
MDAAQVMISLPVGFQGIKLVGKKVLLGFRSYTS